MLRFRFLIHEKINQFIDYFCIMESEDKTIERLIAGGVIDSSLGALITNDRGEGATIGAIAGAVLFATLQANDDAKKTHVPFYIQENNALYLVDAQGQKVFVKEIATPKKVLKEHFILK